MSTAVPFTYNAMFTRNGTPKRGVTKQVLADAVKALPNSGLMHYFLTRKISWLKMKMKREA